MILIILDLEPVPWSAHQGYGRHAYNPRSKEKEAYQILIKSQYKDEPLTLPVSLDLTYYLPISKYASKTRKAQMMDGIFFHIKKPDTSNLTKFCEDCLKGIVFQDDSQVVEIHARKAYGDKPKTIVRVTPLH